MDEFRQDLAKARQNLAEIKINTIESMGYVVLVLARSCRASNAKGCEGGEKLLFADIDENISKI